MPSKILSAGRLARAGAVAAVLGALAQAGAASAATHIDFELKAPCCQGFTTPLSDAYAPLGVTFAGVDGTGGWVLDQTGGFGPEARSGRDFLAMDVESGSGTAEQILFDAPIKAFALFVSGGFSGPGLIRIEAFDAHGASLAAATFDETRNDDRGWTRLQLQASGISKVVFSSDLSDVVADDLSFGGGVPEPAAWTLMIVGFGAAGAALRRRGASVQA